jgi:hypothetical protein
MELTIVRMTIERLGPKELMIVRMTIEGLGPIPHSFNLSFFQSFNWFSSARDGRQERHFITVAKGSISLNVFAVDGGGGHGREGGQARDLPGNRLPELPDAGSFGQLPDLLGKTGGIPKGREVKEIHAHWVQV